MIIYYLACQGLWVYIRKPSNVILRHIRIMA